ncbi:molybdate ABC transporter substrate-binding protein [Alkalicoccus urumqiensis]|uniref:molybdate ABC transporter substrate-binding protein n=1 Tax=Alkalicoccus urumqiensis TaxID=1548213 RepID=UPI0015E5FB13|nr:molybdate ABC transporter substrate-binding protein [Alkalicoccus urumqiensis]
MKRLILWLLPTLFLVGCGDEKTEIHIAAASSLTEVMVPVTDAFERENPEYEIVPTYSASGTLKDQILQGSRADIFVSADPRWVDELEEAHMLEDRVDLLGNRLVLVSPTERDWVIDELTDLPSMHEMETIAIGNPDLVPAGAHARAALEEAGLYDMLEDKFVFSGDVRTAMQYVETDNTDAAFVYETDALASGSVRSDLIIDTPEPIVYPAALMEDREQEEAGAFYAFLQEEEALQIFREHGFQIP